MKRSDCIKAMNDVIRGVPMTSVVRKIIELRPHFKNPWDVGWIRLEVRPKPFDVGVIYVVCYCAQRALTPNVEEMAVAQPDLSLSKLEIRQIPVHSKGKVWVDQCPDCGTIYWGFQL